MHSLNHLGIALLDGNYQIVPGYDVVIDMDVQLDVKRWKYLGEPAFSDYRLYALNGELYLHVNSDTVLITKIRLRAKGFGDDAGSGVAEKDALAGGDDHDKELRLNNLHGGDNLEVTLVHPFNSVWGRVNASKGEKWSNFDKNYAIFSLPAGAGGGKPDEVYAEIAVHPEHSVIRISPDEYDRRPKDDWIKKRARRNFRLDSNVQRRVKTLGVATSSSRPVVPSFFTIDEHWFPGKRDPFKQFSHGGACCIGISADMSVESSRLHGTWNAEDCPTLLVGVGHNRIQYHAKKRQPENETAFVEEGTYVSFFYAFEPRPPFNLVARSGFFCLGFASPKDGGLPNPHSALTHQRTLRQHNETFGCPKTHFVSSMSSAFGCYSINSTHCSWQQVSTIVEKVGDPSSTVIGYGINDCTARLVEVKKEEILKLLFPRPEVMVVNPQS